MIGVLGLGLAWGATTLADIEAAAATVRAPVEAAAGRSFEDFPALVLTTVRGLEAERRELLLREALARGVPRAEAVEQIMAERDAWTVPDSTIMLYTPDDGRIWVIAERLGGVVEPKDDAVRAQLHADSLRCGVAHELVHALQDQAGILDDRTDTASRALVEGQAVLLGRAACGASLAWMGTERLGTTLLDPAHPDVGELALLYGAAPEWISGWLGSRPLSDSWLLFQEPAPEPAQILQHALGPDAKGALDDLARSVAGPDAVEALPMRSALAIATTFLDEDDRLDWGSVALEALARATGFRSARWRATEGRAIEAAMVRFSNADSARQFSQAVCRGWARSRGTWIYITSDPDLQQISRVAYTLWRFPLASARLHGAEASCGSGGPQARDVGVVEGRMPGLTVAIAAFGDRVVYVRAPFARVRRLALGRDMGEAARRSADQGL